jgi:hypothetical protein
MKQRATLSRFGLHASVLSLALSLFLAVGLASAEAARQGRVADQEKVT